MVYAPGSHPLRTRQLHHPAVSLNCMQHTAQTNIMGNCQHRCSDVEQARESRYAMKTLKEYNHHPISSSSKDMVYSSLTTCAMSLRSESSQTMPATPVTPFTMTAPESILPEPQPHQPPPPSLLPIRKLSERRLSLTLEEPDKRSVHSSSTASGGSSASPDLVPDTTTTTTTTTSIFHNSMNRISLCCHEHEELGNIRYQYTSLVEAQQQAQKLHKLIFCIEADIPGDTACGADVLSHPLIVEAAESFFITLVLINPPLNFETSISTSSRCIQRCRTRLRIRDATSTGHDIGTCGVEGNEVMTVANVVEAMLAGLEYYNMETPRYLHLLQEEESGKWQRQQHQQRHQQSIATGLQRRVDRQAVFGVADVALGEVEFAVLYGVLAVKAGQVEQQTVVQVTYDSSRLCYCNLVRHALKRNVADVIYYQNHEERMGARMEAVRMEANPTITEFPGSMQPSHDPKHYLRQTMLRFVPLTDLQAMRANHLVYKGVFNEAMRLLSPRQGVILMQIIRNGNRRHLRDVVDVPIACAWKNVSTVLRS